MRAADGTDPDARLVQELVLRFPLVPRPFEEIGARVGLTEDEAVSKTRALVESGVLRRVGYSVGDGPRKARISTLVGLKTRPDGVDRAVAAIGTRRGVTHNYLRDHEFNIWFTLGGRDRAEVEAELGDIIAKAGPEDWVELPAVRFFKLKGPSMAPERAEVPR